MSAERPEFTEICAYVDGELDAETATRVAYAAARDPHIAAQIAQLTKLKSTVRDAHDRRTPTRFGERGAVRAAAIAAGVLGIAMLSGLLMFDWARPAPGGFVDVAVTTHRAWIAEASSVGHSASPLRMAAVARSRFTAPDLSAARLTLQIAEALDHETRSVLHFGYVGTRGCRLSLFVQLHSDPVSHESASRPGLRTAAWLEKDIGYLAVADGMEEAHFQTIIAALKQYSIEPAPFSVPTETLLAESRMQARPCTA